MKPDLILLHAPSVYDFRKHSIMFGPVSDLVPSSSIFEMYPLGFPILGEYLSRQGFSVRIVNLALRMLKNPRFDVEKFIASLKAYLFGIDFHWLPHAHGSLEVAKIVRKYHPQTPIIFGGFSASYYYKELINYPQVDMIMRGDSTEEPMRLLLEALKKKGSLNSIPNLSWKDGEGSIHHNPIEYVPQNLSHINLDYTFVMRLAARYKDLISTVPFINWLEYPIVAALSCRGCTRSCVTCGGSKYTFREFFNREKPAFRDPELLANDVGEISKYSRGPIFLLGDLLQAGEDYTQTFLMALKKKKIKNQVAFEFFTPPSPGFWSMVREVLPHWSIEISLESHDEEVRKFFGKGIYTNEELEESLGEALRKGCERVDLYFMSGIPKQTKKSILETIGYCDHLYHKFQDRRLLVFISPMAPFLDPGSLVFEKPSLFGYHLLSKSLEDHRQALLQPSWKYMLNYESSCLSRDELVESTYEAALGLNRLKAKYRVIKEKAARDVERRILKAREIVKQIDEVMEKISSSGEKNVFKNLQEEMLEYSTSTICEKRELEWPIPVFRKFKMAKIIPFLLFKR